MCLLKQWLKEELILKIWTIKASRLEDKVGKIPCVVIQLRQDDVVKPCILLFASKPVGEQKELLE